jgi:hypothetical protein
MEIGREQEGESETGVVESKIPRHGNKMKHCVVQIPRRKKYMRT